MLEKRSRSFVIVAAEAGFWEQKPVTWAVGARDSQILAAIEPKHGGTQHYDDDGWLDGALAASSQSWAT